MHPDRFNLINVTLWIAFFATSVYGYVGLRLAARDVGLTVTAGSLWSIYSSWWGITSLIAWGASAIIWTAIMQRETLTYANNFSLLRFGLVALAGHFLLGESLGAGALVGLLLMFVGIVLL